MKKATIVFGFAMFAVSGGAFAGSLGANVPPTVSSEFSQQFSKASHVQWEEGQDFYKATFEASGKTLFAFYTGTGDLMGVAANQPAAGLPQRLKDQLHRQYAGYWITDLFAYHNEDEGGLVITIENPDRIVVLKARGQSEWSLYRTTVKP